MWLLIPWDWSGAQDSAFLTDLWVMPMLPLGEAHSEAPSSLRLLYHSHRLASLSFPICQMGEIAFGLQGWNEYWVI